MTEALLDLMLRIAREQIRSASHVYSARGGVGGRYISAGRGSLPRWVYLGDPELRDIWVPWSLVVTNDSATRDPALALAGERAGLLEVYFSLCRLTEAGWSASGVDGQVELALLMLGGDRRDVASRDRLRSTGNR